ncbi:MAG: DUF2089 domain-containing protein [Chloroflexi bacterium]|jgi:hypothetical protein|nr:DUF2089 domain-containing protein [Chloroflexota bacterium]MBK6710382.1 DUF2089 domain-containing protein [Chloroflexota bacterium]MBK7180091.1 DUF2089 domain-containing protein [Chloroflexota bacterium]MBK7917695.1 DUF2089 domain-containing protein [Chloroflexota bacterium]MBK8934756.1 DUF2089 domain-containing protein [Chloroflexota bacterium]
MNPVIGQCPICNDTLTVTRLHCRTCDTTIEGHFTLGRLYELSAEQLNFVELFIRCEGKINRVEQELGMSYPAVRARLTEVIEAMGYEVGEPERTPMSEGTRREILAEVSAGTLSADEALQILRGGS